MTQNTVADELGRMERHIAQLNNTADMILDGYLLIQRRHADMIAERDRRIAELEERIRELEQYAADMNAMLDGAK